MKPLSVTSTPEARRRHYDEVLAACRSLIADEDDWVAVMATVAGELHGAFDYFHWTGFYRHIRARELVIGPYQGGHGCLRIAFDRGVCGAAARTKTTQRVDDVNSFSGHIACSSSTQSEIVVPVVTGDGRLLAVLDIDSDYPAAFAEIDQQALEQLCAELGQRFGQW